MTTDDLTRVCFGSRCETLKIGVISHYQSFIFTCVSFHFLFCFFLRFFSIFCFFFIFTFGQVEGNACDSRSLHRPTKGFEFVCKKLILRPQKVAIGNAKLEIRWNWALVQTQHCPEYRQQNTRRRVVVK